MIRDNTDCPYLHDIFDQYCNLFKGYKNCNKCNCEVLKILKENEQLKVQIEKMKRCTNCKHNECKCEDVVCKKENECWYDKAEEEHLFLELEKVKLECWELAE